MSEGETALFGTPDAGPFDAVFRMPRFGTPDAGPFDAVFRMPRFGTTDATFRETRFGCHELNSKINFRS